MQRGKGKGRSRSHNQNSPTVTVKEVVTAALLRESLALQVTVEVPRGKVSPEGGSQVTDEEPSTISVAVGGV